jgi:hypothetical protein
MYEIYIKGYGNKWILFWRIQDKIKALYHLKGLMKYEKQIKFIQKGAENEARI